MDSIDHVNPNSVIPIENSTTEEINDSPIEQVRLTVPITDDPKMPCLTFRTWLLGLTSCIVLAFLNQFFGYRQNPLSISSVCVQIAVLPVGKLLAATLPTKSLRIPMTRWSPTLNPGPFNIKEHVLISIFASTGATPVYGVGLVTIIKIFYHKEIHPFAALLLVLTTQMLGYGWAGLFRKYLVESPYMWWPSKLVDVSLFRALHEDNKRTKGKLTRLQFFLIVIVLSFSYYTIPGYFFPSISTISIACLIWTNSVTAHQIGSGIHGLGIGSFALDWNTVAGFLGSPLATPAFAIANVLVGFFLVVYVLTPILYWSDSFGAKRFPMVSSNLFDSTGGAYNITRVLNQETFQMDEVDYEGYSKVHLSTLFALSYGLSFGTLSASISHVVLFHGKTIMKMWSETRDVVRNADGDVHSRLMSKYPSVPQWWFHIILVSMVGLAIFTCEGFNKQLQLPYWGIFLTCGLAIFFTLPIGVISATTNQTPGLNVITELVIGYLYPGRPLANMAFKTYGSISMAQAITFLQDFKLGHYMKIPPRAMFIVQLTGTIVASTVYFTTSWWLLTTIPNICDPLHLPQGSPWTCPGDKLFYSASIIWGIIGPLRMFGKLGLYSEMNWFFLIGLIAPVPVWLLSRYFPEKKWIKDINMAVIIGGAGGMPLVRSINFLSWGFVGILFNFYIYKTYRGWWASHTYVLSAGLEAGVAFMAILSYFALQSNNINGVAWWGLETDDHCTLALCPTAIGVAVEGCPVF